MRRGSISLPPEMSDVNIMLLGSTGSGKSATGNTIIGGDIKPFEEYLSLEETRFCESAQTVLNGQSITVFDTAGLSDTSVKITEAQSQIEKMLQDGVDVFLLVIKLGPFTETDCKVVKWIQDNFGAKLLKHTLVLFTHGDQFRVPVEDYLGKCESLRSVVDQCSGGFHVFNNKDEDRSQVTELLDKINTLRRKNGDRRYRQQDYKETQNLLFKFSALRAQIHDIGTRLHDAPAMAQLDAARAAGAPGVAGVAAGLRRAAAAAGLGREAGLALAVAAELRRAAAAAAAGLGRAAVEAAGAAVAVGIGGTVFTGPKRGAALAAAVGAGVYFARKYYYREKR